MKHVKLFEEHLNEAREKFLTIDPYNEQTVIELAKEQAGKRRWDGFLPSYAEIKQNLLSQHNIKWAEVEGASYTTMIKWFVSDKLWFGSYVDADGKIGLVIMRGGDKTNVYFSHYKSDAEAWNAVNAAVKGDKAAMGKIQADKALSLSAADARKKLTELERLFANGKASDKYDTLMGSIAALRTIVDML